MKPVSSRVISRLALLPIMLAITPNIRANENEMTLCKPHEDIYFSCQTENGKIISLCASGNISPDHGYVQYRFGVPSYIELPFPSKPSAPRNIFSISNVHEGSMNFTNLKFKSGKYYYVIYHDPLWGGSGVYVKVKEDKKSGKTLSQLSCQYDGIYKRLNREVFRGIKMVPPIYGID